GAPGGERVDVALTDLGARGPRRQLVDLGLELVEVVADELDEPRARLVCRTRADARELLARPLREVALRHVVDEHVARLRARLRERRVALHLRAVQGEYGVWGGAREVGGDRLRVGCLPTVDG